MIINAGAMRVRKGSMDAVVEALRLATTPSLAEEGVLVYTFGIDLADADVVRVYEEYRDLEALASHGEQEHTRTLFATLRDHLDGRPQIHTYEAVTVERG